MCMRSVAWPGKRKPGLQPGIFLCAEPEGSTSAMPGVNFQSIRCAELCCLRTTAPPPVEPEGFPGMPPG